MNEKETQFILDLFAELRMSPDLYTISRMFTIVQKEGVPFSVVIKNIVSCANELSADDDDGHKYPTLNNLLGLSDLSVTAHGVLDREVF